MHDNQTHEKHVQDGTILMVSIYSIIDSVPTENRMSNEQGLMHAIHLRTPRTVKFSITL